MALSIDYEHKLNFEIDASPLVSWAYADNTVVGTLIDAEVLSALDMRQMVDQANVFNANLATGAWGVAPVEGILTEGYTEIISWPTGTTRKEEVSIGDLTWELVYDLTADEYTLTSSVFSLAWTDYLWFCKRWRFFVRPGVEVV